MQWTCLYHDNNDIPMCFTESNQDYNSKIEISVKNYMQYKRFKCEKKLSWRPYEKNFSHDAFSLLYCCDSVKHYALQEDLNDVLSSWCLDFITFDFVPYQNAIYIRRCDLEKIQNEIYQKTIYRKMSTFPDLDLENAMWYYNYFYYVPLLSKRYAAKVEKLKKKKEQFNITAVTQAKRILEEYKTLMNEIIFKTPNQDDALILIQYIP